MSPNPQQNQEKSTRNIFAVSNRKHGTALDELLILRREHEQAEMKLKEANQAILEKYLTGHLDTTGHKVHIHVKRIGRRIVKTLVIDGSGALNRRRSDRPPRGES